MKIIWIVLIIKYKKQKILKWRTKKLLILLIIKLKNKKNLKLTEKIIKKKITKKKISKKKLQKVFFIFFYISFF